jgi:hypothetical protein
MDYLGDSAPTEFRGEEYTFTGRTEHVPEADYIFVIAKAPSSASAGLGASSSPSAGLGTSQSWLVSPFADVNAHGHWSVKWKLSHPPKAATWIAVVFNSSCPAAATGGSCSGNPFAILGTEGPGAADAIGVYKKAPSGASH